jgi:hypothetical protein
MTLVQAVKMFAVTNLVETTRALQELEQTLLAHGSHTVETLQQHSALMGKVRVLGDLALIIGEQIEIDEGNRPEVAVMTDEDVVNLEKAWEQMFVPFFEQIEREAVMRAAAEMVDSLTAATGDGNENATPGG